MTYVFALLFVGLLVEAFFMRRAVMRLTHLAVHSHDTPSINHGLPASYLGTTLLPTSTSSSINSEYEWVDDPDQFLDE